MQYSSITNDPELGELQGKQIEDDDYRSIRKNTGFVALMVIVLVWMGGAAASRGSVTKTTLAQVSGDDGAAPAKALKADNDNPMTADDTVDCQGGGGRCEEAKDAKASTEKKSKAAEEGGDDAVNCSTHDDCSDLYPNQLDDNWIAVTDDKKPSKKSAKSTTKALKADNDNPMTADDTVDCQGGGGRCEEAKDAKASTEKKSKAAEEGGDDAVNCSTHDDCSDLYPNQLDDNWIAVTDDKKPSKKSSTTSSAKAAAEEKDKAAVRAALASDATAALASQKKPPHSPSAGGAGGRGESGDGVAPSPHAAAAKDAAGVDRSGPVDCDSPEKCAEQADSVASVHAAGVDKSGPVDCDGPEKC